MFSGLTAHSHCSTRVLDALQDAGTLLAHHRRHQYTGALTMGGGGRVLGDAVVTKVCAALSAAHSATFQDAMSVDVACHTGAGGAAADATLPPLAAGDSPVKIPSIAAAAEATAVAAAVGMWVKAEGVAVAEARRGAGATRSLRMQRTTSSGGSSMSGHTTQPTCGGRVEGRRVGCGRSGQAEGWGWDWLANGDQCQGAGAHFVQAVYVGQEDRSDDRPAAPPCCPSARAWAHPQARPTGASVRPHLCVALWRHGPPHGDHGVG